MSFLGKFGIGSMNLRRRKPRRCFPLTLGPLDPGSLGNDGEVGLPCPDLSYFTRLFSSPDCTQISEQCSVLYCELCPWLRWTTWWEDLILGEVAEDMIMSLSETVTPEFDTIMCLSTTKWIHLNFGDEGLKRVFRRIYAQLRPGGTFILESQAFCTYRKKKKLTEKIFHNFKVAICGAIDKR